MGRNTALVRGSGRFGPGWIWVRITALTSVDGLMKKSVSKKRKKRKNKKEEL